MTFSHIGNGLYTCLSTDTKVTTGMTTNSILFEIDTGTIYKFASGAWSAVGGGGSGAPTTSQYVTLATDGGLSNERVLTAGTNVTLTDGGAGSTITIGLGTGVTTNTGTQTLTNKTIDTATNTITGIADTNITAHTTTKITTSSKSLLNSAIVYNDQTNSFGDFNQVFKDNRLLINNPADTFAYTIVGAAIAANRTLTLPLLTGSDTAVTEAFTQTLSNKTIAAGSNTVTGIVDANIDAHTSTKITITAKGQLNSSLLYTDQANTLGDFNFTLKDNRLLINNPADTFNYTIIAAAIAANRTITLPLLIGNDVMVTEAFTQTLTNKTLAAGSNTITGIADTNITAHTSTKITITAKGQLNSALVYTDQANTFGASLQTFKSSNFIIRNPADTFSYTLVAGAIGADRSLTLPVLTGTDTLAVLDLAQTFTNKTIAAGSNTITGIVDANIGTHTTTKITTSSKSLLNSAIAYNDQANVFGAFDQTIPSTNFKLSNSGFSAALSVGTLAGNITITLPNTTSTLVISTDSRLSDARTPTTHASTHNAAGSDVVHIDTIGAGTDITTNNASTTKHGLLKKLSNVATEYMDGTGAWSTPAGGTGGSSTLAGDTDVTITSPAQYDVLQYGAASKWVNALIDNNNIAAAAGIVKSKLASLGIVDADVATHTTTKITTTAKGQLNSAIVYTDQANSMGDFNLTLKDNRLLINNPADTFAYTFIAAAIAAARTITLPLLTGNDIMVTEAFTQTLTNKTMSGSSNTFSNIPYTALTSVPTTIVKTDQTNTYGAFAQIFPSSQLKVQNPGATFNYIMAGSAIVADRTVTLPLLAGNDVLVTEAFAQTLTNKTIVAGNNTITGIVDANITAHISTKITITDKTHLNSAIVYNDQANTYGNFVQSFLTSTAKVMNPANTFGYLIAGSAITTANRTITLPLLTADDTFTMNSFAQTLTNKTLTSPTIGTILNTGTLTLPTATTTLVGTDTTDTLTSKTINATNNTITDTSGATGDILRHNGTKFVRLARGSANQVLTTNSGATDIAWAAPAGGSGFTETKGVSTQSGNASTTVFTIAHGLGSAPSWCSCIGSAVDSDSDFSYATDATNITVTYPFAPPTGTNNLTFQWRVTA
jgi:hypothetical protein